MSKFLADVKDPDSKVKDAREIRNCNSDTLLSKNG